MSKISENIKKITEEKEEKEESRPLLRTTTPTYQGVSVENPRIIEAIKNMKKQGRRDEEISKVVGMPMEVVRRHNPDK